MRPPLHLLLVVACLIPGCQDSGTTSPSPVAPVPPPAAATPPPPPEPEPGPGRDGQISTWQDDSRRLIGAFRDYDFDAYLTLAFEAFEAERSESPRQV